MSRPPSPSSTSSASRAKLAALLADTTKEIENLRQALSDSQRKAAHFESLLNNLQYASTNSKDAEAIQQHIRRLEQRTIEAERVRDAEIARRVAITDLWAQYRNYAEVAEAHIRDARAGFEDVVRHGGGVLKLSRIPTVEENSRYMPSHSPSQTTARVRPRSDSFENGGHGGKRPRSSYQQYPYYQGRPHSPSSHAHHRRRSPSVDVDEMIMQASSSSQHNQRYPNDNTYPHGRGAEYPHRQPPPQQQQHVFAPVVTGPPKSSSSKSRTVGALNLDDGGSVSSSAPNSAALSSAAPASAAFPATNEHGQRICRMCGVAGRVKDGKCVEKWGPGPWGPGTVCDRCRKKMKRVERRGTMEQQLQQQASQASVPLGRTDTVLSTSGGGHSSMPPPPPGAAGPPRILSPGPSTGSSPSRSPVATRSPPRPATTRSPSRPTMTTTSHERRSSSDEDADGEAEEPEPEVEADLLEAVDAADEERVKEDD